MALRVLGGVLLLSLAHSGDGQARGQAPHTATAIGTAPTAATYSHYLAVDVDVDGVLHKLTWPAHASLDEMRTSANEFVAAHGLEGNYDVDDEHTSSSNELVDLLVKMMMKAPEMKRDESCWVEPLSLEERAATRPPVRPGGGLYHRVVNAQHRGELIELANTLGLTGRAAEIGVFTGTFARHNLERWQGEKYYLIDAWDHRSNDTDAQNVTSTDKNYDGEDGQQKWNFVYERAREEVSQWLPSGRAVMMRRFSEAAAAEFPDEHFDFIYIDAGHEYRNVRRDLLAWWPKLAVGGMLCGDDFADLHDSFSSVQIHRYHGWGVKSAVSQFSREVGSPFFLTYADRLHEEHPETAEWDHDRPSDLGSAQHHPERPPPEHTVRAHQFYPAWYMFK